MKMKFPPGMEPRCELVVLLGDDDDVVRTGNVLGRPMKRRGDRQLRSTSNDRQVNDGAGAKITDNEAETVGDASPGAFDRLAVQSDDDVVFCYTGVKGSGIVNDTGHEHTDTPFGQFGVTAFGKPRVRATGLLRSHADAEESVLVQNVVIQAGSPHDLFDAQLRF